VAEARQTLARAGEHGRLTLPLEPLKRLGDQLPGALIDLPLAVDALDLTRQLVAPGLQLRDPVGGLDGAAVACRLLFLAQGIVARALLRLQVGVELRALV
jgi:hypothetical protein